MRKIISQEEKDKKSRRNQLIVGGILIFVMLFSTLGYAFYGKSEESSSSKQKIEYNGYEFVSNGNIWILNLGEYQFGFKTNPLELEKMNIEGSSSLKDLNNYQGKVLYLDSDNNEASSEIYMNLANSVQRVQQACLNATKCKSSEFPIKDCSENMIIIRESNNSKITQENNCVFIEGKKEELIKISDNFLLDIIGVK